MFNANGHGTAPSSIEITAATNITLPNITAKGYTFDGWYKSATDFSDANRVGGHNDSVSVDTPTTFYAKWTAKTYTINYNTNGGDVSPEYFTKTYDTAYAGNLAEPTKTGYTFAGWFTDNNTLTMHTINNDDIYEEGKTTPYYIYAKWNAKTYTIHYNLNGGTNTGSVEFEKLLELHLLENLLILLRQDTLLQDGTETTLHSILYMIRLRMTFIQKA